MNSPAFTAAPTSQASAPSLQSPVTTEIGSLFADAVYGPVQPGDPNPVTPNPLTEALWAAYRQSETAAPTAEPAAGTATNQPAASNTDLTVVDTIPVDPAQIALSPDGTRLYGTSVLSEDPNTGGLAPATVQVVDTYTNTQVGDPIPVGGLAEGVVVDAATHRAYVTVTNPVTFTLPSGQQIPGNSDSLVVIDTTTNKVIGSPIPIGASQNGNQITETLGTSGGSESNIALSPDGSRVYVSETLLSADLTNISTETTQPVVYVFNTATNTQVGDPIPLGPPTNFATSAQSLVLSGPITISPSGDRLYATTLQNSSNSGQSSFTETIHQISPTTGADVGPSIVLSDNYVAAVVAPAVLSPDGKKLYVESLPISAVSQSSNSQQLPNAAVLTYDAASGQQIGTPINVTGFGPMAISPDGKTLYVADIYDPRSGQTGTYNALGQSQTESVPLGSVTAYDASTGAQIGNPVTVGVSPSSLAINSAGTRLYVANAGDNTISVINITPANTNTGNPLEFVSSAIIAINSFAQVAASDIGSIFTGINNDIGSFARGVNASVAQLAEKSAADFLTAAGSFVTNAVTFATQISPVELVLRLADVAKFVGDVANLAVSIEARNVKIAFDALSSVEKDTLFATAADAADGAEIVSKSGAALLGEAVRILGKFAPALDVVFVGIAFEESQTAQTASQVADAGIDTVAAEAPLAGAAIGLVVGGPVGAGVGFLAGGALGVGLTIGDGIGHALFG